ncbi:MAG: hypothetical protein ACLUGO_06120 [Mediterraneibacter faecis]
MADDIIKLKSCKVADAENRSSNPLVKTAVGNQSSEQYVQKQQRLLARSAGAQQEFCKQCKSPISFAKLGKRYCRKGCCDPDIAKMSRLNRCAQRDLGKS